MDPEESRLQSLQRGPAGRILQVEAHHHQESNQHIVFWDDIVEAFPGATSVLNGTVVANRARDAAFRFIEPRCIKYQAGKVLEVVGGEDMTTLGGSTFEATPMPRQLTYKNIEQWAAMTIPQETILGGMYAPTIYTMTTTRTRPFKPLLVPTEASASSVRAESVQEQEEENEDEDAEADSQEGEQEQEINLTKFFPEIATFEIAANESTTEYPLSSPFDQPPSSLLPGPNLHNFDFEPRPLPATPDMDLLGNSSYPPSNSNANFTNLYTNKGYNGHNSISSSGSNGGPISPTSLSSMSTAYTYTPPTPPAATKTKKPGFFKSTFNRLAGRTPITLVHHEPTVETESAQSTSFYSQYPPLHNIPQEDVNTYQLPHVGYIEGTQPPATHFRNLPKPLRFLGQESWIPTEPGDKEEVEVEVDYNELFRKVEADRVRRWNDQTAKANGPAITVKPYIPKTKYIPENHHSLS